MAGTTGAAGRGSIAAGIDIGGTTTKIAAFRDGEPVGYLSVRASDPVTSAAGALGKFLSVHELPLGAVRSVVTTGVGGGAIEGDLLGIATVRLDEFRAIGRGGLYLSGLERAVVVSMGTGTAIVRAESGSIVHLGGTGVGGGTLLGLGRTILGTADFGTIIDMASRGSLANVDLQVGDISLSDIGDLPRETTASNFGKVGDRAAGEDKALGILNLVFQTIGLIAIFAARAEGIGDIVLTGNLSRVSQAPGMFRALSDLFGGVFHFPENSEYATAVGAALSVGEVRQ